MTKWIMPYAIKSNWGSDAIRLPPGASFRNAGLHGTTTILWFEIDPDVPESDYEWRYFLIVGNRTGVNDTATYLATVQHSEDERGTLHIYEVTP